MDRDFKDTDTDRQNKIDREKGVLRGRERQKDLIIDRKKEFCNDASKETLYVRLLLQVRERRYVESFT